jgi:hypothetical protein
MGRLRRGCHLNDLVQDGQCQSGLPRFLQGVGIVEKRLVESAFQVVSEVLHPLVPTANSGEDEVVQHRSAPESPSIFDPTVGQCVGEELEIGDQSPFPEGKGILVIEEILPDGASQNPQRLANGVPPLGMVGIGPEDLGQCVPGNRRRVTGYINEEGQGFP